jgi:hypothetical protein
MSLNFVGVPIGSAITGPLLEHSLVLPLLLGAGISVISVVAALVLIPSHHRRADGTAGT